MTEMNNQLISHHLGSSLQGYSIGDDHRYHLKAQLGQGGMGDVYQALDTRLGKIVAIKLLRRPVNPVSSAVELEIRRRFERECAVCAVLKNSNIVQVSDYGETAEGGMFFVMEYLEGQTLKHLLRQESKLSVKRSISIILQICHGLKSAHAGVSFNTPGTNTHQRIKIIHCDLKPANIFIVPDGQEEHVKIIDFGAAKLQAPHLEKMNLGNFFLGTHHYASPEQLDPSQEVDPRSDIYCLGIMLYEMLSGLDPFGLIVQGRRITGESWVKAHLLKTAQSLHTQDGYEHISAALNQVVMRCLAKSPEQRFASVEDLAQSLEAVLNTTPENLPSAPVSAEVSVVLDEAFIDQCQAKLIEEIGPIGKLIIEQTLKEHYQRQRAEFVAAIVDQIPDAECARHFQQGVLNS
jgi:eukaryotic-like serine/threonine-protein kinase